MRLTTSTSLGRSIQFRAYRSSSNLTVVPSASFAPSPSHDRQLDAHLLYPVVIWVSVQYGSHIWSRLLTQLMRGNQSSMPAEITASSERRGASGPNQRPCCLSLRRL